MLETSGWSCGEGSMVNVQNVLKPVQKGKENESKTTYRGREAVGQGLIFYHIHEEIPHLILPCAT